jgi:hypothetical protein
MGVGMSVGISVGMSVGMDIGSGQSILGWSQIHTVREIFEGAT